MHGILLAQIVFIVIIICLVLKNEKFYCSFESFAFMLFESINKAYCWFFLFIIISLEIAVLVKGNNNFQSEIYLKQIDIINDRPGVIQLLPGVGEKKLAEILELRKTEKSASKILEIIGLKYKNSENDSILIEE